MSREVAGGVAGSTVFSSTIAVSAAVATLAATVFGAADIYRSGVFDWHLQQPTFQRGALELGCLAVLFWLALRVRHDKRRLAAAVIIVASYARLHEVDLAIAASGIYCLGLYGLGAAIDRYLLRTPRDHANLGRAFALGLAALSTVLWGTALGVGLDFEANRLVAFAVAGTGLVAWLVRRPWASFAPPVRQDGISAAATALCVTCLLAILVRSNSVIYYDSIWYGARPDRVLFGTHGVFGFLGLTTQVHYYPKMYEVAVAPLQGLGDLSFAIAFNVGCVLLLAHAVRQLGLTCGLDPRRAWVIAVVTACFPACAGVAETTKGDVLAAAFVLLAVNAYQRQRSDRSGRHFGDVLAYALLASGLRLSTLPWLVALLVIVALAMTRCLADGSCRRDLWSRGSLGIALLAGVSTALVHYRTFVLTGTPLITNASTQALFDQMGWTLRYPIGALTGGEPAAGLHGLIDVAGIALSPTRYVFHIFKWSGAIWLIGGVVAVLAAVRLSRARSWAVANSGPLVVGLSLPALLCLNSWPVPGGDGNYFLVPMACLAVAGFAAVPPLRLLDRTLLACGGIGLAAYLLTANWVPGIKVEPPSLTRSPFDADAQLATYVESADLTYVANYFAKCNRLTRVTGLLPETGQAFALPIRYEPLNELQWNNGPSFASVDAFHRLMRATGTQFLVLPVSPSLPQVKSRHDLYVFTEKVVEQLGARGLAVRRGTRGNYAIYQMMDAAPPRGCDLASP